MRNSIVHGGEYNGDIINDYLELSDKVRAAIKYCNVHDLTKEKLFEDLNSRGFFDGQDNQNKSFRTTCLRTSS